MIDGRGNLIVDRSGHATVMGRTVLNNVGYPLKHAGVPAEGSRLHGDLGQHTDGTPGWNIDPWPEGYVESDADKTKHHEHTCFNLRRSDSIPLDRNNGDRRHSGCKDKLYTKDLPTTSVIFVFFNE
jgi:hypothetical protein